MLKGFVPWPKEYVKLYKEKGYWQGVTIGEAFETWCKKYSERPALIYNGKEITYRQLDDYATRIAYQMTELGIKTYDRIVMQMFNSAELVYLFYACMKIGAIPICSLPTHRWAEISYVAKHSEARVHAIPAGTVKDFDYEEFADKVRQEIPGMKIVLTVGKPVRSGMYSINELMEKEIDLEKARAKLKKYRPDPMEPALFQLSGGTTGVPKIIPRTHNDYYYNVKCTVEALGYDTNVRSLAAGPLVHNFALINVLLPIHMSGGIIVLSSSFASEALLKAIAEYRVNYIQLPSPLIHRLVDLPIEVVEKYDISSLYRFMTSWNPEDPAIPVFMSRFHCDGIQGYGMSEGLICWSRWSDPQDIRHNTDGRAVSEADEVQVVDPETHAPVAPGQIGECWCRGPYTIRGYYKAPERNKEAFTPDGYYRTGDLVTMDAAGNITWKGRIKDCIDRGGEKINAEEVENYILKFSKVNSVAVIGMPDKEFGERICAFVVLKGGATFTLEELQDFLVKEVHVARFKVPERLEFIDELPITKIGKYEKKSLKEKITSILKKEGKI
ncbi:MAG: AMP-binding protein [Dehalococcoidia bacterium]|jgi:2,3-dihydroxybenzoate-AMP ligase